MRKSEIIILLIILASFAVGIYVYPQMPDKMASRWNAQGRVDGYMPTFLGVFLIPFIGFGMLLLFIFIPRIDPLKENIEKFRKYFDGFIILITLFLLYVFLLTIFWNLGVEFSMNRVLPPALGILLFYAGVLMEKTKRNWFVGIRTPWTLSSERVWDETHRIGGKLFKIAGAIALLGIIFPSYAILFILVPVISSAIYTAAFSYFKYRNEKVNK